VNVNILVETRLVINRRGTSTEESCDEKRIGPAMVADLTPTGLAYAFRCRKYSIPLRQARIISDVGKLQ
jgi:hypothetical protein